MRFKLYKLEGRSLTAAKKLEKLVESAFLAEKMSYSGRNLADIQREAVRFSRTLAERLAREEPAIMKAAGLLKPATVIHTEPGAHPRAYEVYPRIHASPRRARDYYMYVPVDYKGGHFAPPGAKAVTKKQEAAVENLLFAGGWLDNAPLLYRPERGIALPRGYAQPKAKAPETKLKVFIAAGRSLECVKDYAAAAKAHEKAVSGAFDAIDDAFAKLKQENGAAGENWYLNKSMTNSISRMDEGLPAIKPQYFISVRKGGSGETVSGHAWLKENKYFRVTGAKHGDDRIEARTDTPEGLALHRKLDAVGIRPSIASYWQLRNPTAPSVKDEFARALGVDNAVPKLESKGGVHYLIYRVAPAGKDHCLPPDGIPVSEAEYLWAKADAEDVSRGILPPPPPAPLAHLQPLKPVRPQAKPG
jgi:hypothetical protein